jgi:YD repeat-containing protein
MRAARFNHVSVHARNLEHLPDGSVQMYLRDPAGNLIEIDWPDVTTLDRSLLPELKRLADTVPQTGDAQRATLYLEKAQL